MENHLCRFGWLARSVLVIGAFLPSAAEANLRRIGVPASLRARLLRGSSVTMIRRAGRDRAEVAITQHALWQRLAADWHPVGTNPGTELLLEGTPAVHLRVGDKRSGALSLRFGSPRGDLLETLMIGPNNVSIGT